MQLGTPKERLQAHLQEIEGLLQKHRVLETFTHRQQTTRRELLERLQHQQNLVELQSRCGRLHPADLAFVLESLPLDDRALVWQQTPPALKGQVIVEVSDVVRVGLIEGTAPETLVEALRDLEPDDLAFLEEEIPESVWRQVSSRLGDGDLSRLREAMSFPETAVGSLMHRDVPAVRETLTVQEALADLRGQSELPAHLHQLCVVDGRRVLRGVVPFADVIRQPSDAVLSSFMTTEPVVFGASDPLDAAARAFERYDLVSAPVIDERGKLVGRLTADRMIDYIRTESDRAALARAGLGREEDLFAPVFDSARNRWPWLLVNLMTAFFASRVIGVFEQTIGQLVALATLMPIVASVGGNTGNQTVALVIRGLALEQLQPGTFGHLLRKECSSCSLAWRVCS